MSAFYHTLFFDPLYNTLALLSNMLPWANAGILVIILTILVRLILFPLSRKAVVTQLKMSEIAPELEAIKEKYKSDRDEMAKRTLSLYREKGFNPFSGIFVLIIQIPIIFALYQIFLHLPEVNPSLLYSFISAPPAVNTEFFGIDLTSKSIFLAILAGASMLFHLHLSSKGQKSPTGNSFSDNLSRNMQMQAKYVLPLITAGFAYSISGVIGLYFFTTNIFSVIQDAFIKRNIKARS